MQQKKDGIYARYCSMGRKVELSGAVTLAAAVAGHVISGGNAFLSVLGGIGLLILVFGFAKMRPNNQIKSFAQQLTNTPDRDFAQGLLEAMEKNGKTALTRRSLSSVQLAVNAYAASPEADEALVQQLADALQKHLRSVIF